MSGSIRILRGAALSAVLALLASACHAGSARFCDRPADLSAAQQDTLFRFGGLIKAELEASGQRAALIARSGLDLHRLGARYSHAGVSLQDGADTPWSVRQLYYACDERRPRLYDQGMAGFLLGTDNPSLGYVSVVLLPEAEAAALARAALDKRQALDVLAPAYSANAYAFGERYQNCNQWVAELLAAAWARTDEAPAIPGATSPRAHAQRWLQAHGYTPSEFRFAFPPLMWLGAFIPWVHSDDHPHEDIVQAVYRVSMPASIEAFVHAQVPGATRLEFCHTERYAVIRRGWEPIADGCVPGVQDTVISLSDAD
jgi:hypothetical protein